MMKMIGAPLVYVGPTSSAEAIQRVYPGCIVRPPIRRGDLYRDRMLRGTAFLILDGVFFQDEAISPREILDVIGDGALVVGAASMGALRAAECWPAGMRGVGAIYRLFRSGALESDDEVAVAFSAGPSGASSSVALINVRYAVRHAERARLLDSGEARHIVGTAREMFYADRHWPLILRAANLGHRAPLAAALPNYDLKARDAQRALERVKRWLAEDPDLLTRPRASRRAFTSSEERRERAHDASDVCTHHAEALTLTRAEQRRELARRMFASGRYIRWAASLTAAADALRNPDERAKRAVPSGRVDPPETELAKPPRATSRRARIQAAGDAVDAELARHEIETSSAMRAAYAAMATQAARERALLRAFIADEARYADLLWLALDASAELDAELFRFHAQRLAAARTLAGGTPPSPLDRCAAELRIATSHGFPSWAALIEALEDCPEARVLIDEHCRHATLAQAAIRREFARTL